MLPAQHKLTSSAQFRATMRKGRRAGSTTVVVHQWDSAQAQPESIIFGGPKFGLIVSKAVGNAVIRHHTSRRLRHVCATLLKEAPELFRRSDYVVIRALAPAGTATSEQLAHDIRRGLVKVNRVSQH